MTCLLKSSWRILFHKACPAHAWVWPHRGTFVILCLHLRMPCGLLMHSTLYGSLMAASCSFGPLGLGAQHVDNRGTHG
jgi:hypothetical protein